MNGLLLDLHVLKTSTAFLFGLIIVVDVVDFVAVVDIFDVLEVVPVAVLEVLRVVVKVLVVVIIAVVEVFAVAENVFSHNLTQTPDLAKFGLKGDPCNKFKDHVIPEMI